MSHEQITCWADGAVDTYHAGIGWEVTGAVETRGSRPIDENITSMEAELFAALEAVRVSAREGSCDETIVLYTDCEPLKRKLTASYEEREDWDEYRRSAQWLLNKFDSWEVRVCDRSHNNDAHELAREALTECRKP